MIVGFGILVSRGLTVNPPSLSAWVFATLLSSPCMVRNILSSRLQTTGTTVRSRRKLVNRLRSISPFSSISLEALSSDTHTVTHSLNGYEVYPSSSLLQFRPVARLQLLSTHLTSILLPLRPSRLTPLSHPLGYALSLYSTASVANVNTLGPLDVMFCSSTCSVLPAPLYLLGFPAVITIISYVGVYGKGFPVASSLCFYLIFLSCPR